MDNTTLTLDLSRVYKADKQRVYDAWTHPEAIKQWFGPPTCPVTKAEMDLREGGRFVFDMDNKEMPGLQISGYYKEIAPPDRLVFSWKWLTAPMSELIETEVTVEFLDHADGTEVRLAHRGFPAEEPRTNHNQGWCGTLDKLEAFLD